MSINYKDQKIICREYQKKNESDEPKERKKKIALFLLMAIGLGHTAYQVSSKPEAGNVIVKDRDGKPVTISLHTEEGFSIEDFVRTDSYSAIYNTMRSNFTKSEIEGMFAELEKNKDISFKKSIGKDGNIRYNIEDDALKELFIWHFNILKHAIEMMKQYWFILNKRPKSEEIRWYIFIEGKEAATAFFHRVSQNRDGKKTIKERYIEFHFENKDRKYIERSIENTERSIPSIFTVKGMTEFIFKKSSDALLMGNKRKYLETTDKYKKLLDSGKYKWILDELKSMALPEFLKTYQ